MEDTLAGKLVYGILTVRGICYPDIGSGLLLVIVEKFGDFFGLEFTVAAVAETAYFNQSAIAPVSYRIGMHVQ